jgi:hypothetical protein
LTQTVNEHDLEFMAQCLKYVDQISEDQHKTFSFGGKEHSFKVAQAIGEAEGRIWAYSGGIIIHESSSGAAIITPESDLNMRMYDPFPWSVHDKNKIYTPLDRHTQALVQWDAVRWAMHSKAENLTGIIVPDSLVLVGVLQFLYAVEDPEDKLSVPDEAISKVKLDM